VKIIAVIAIVACLAIGAVVAKREAVASFERAVATHQARSEA